MFAEALTVIADDHYDGAIEHSALVEKRNHPGELKVDEADGAGVWILAVRGCKFRRRLSGRMRVVEMQPRKEAAAVHLVQPAERIVHDAVGRAAKRLAIDRAWMSIRLAIDIEALIEPPLVIEHEAADEGARFESAGVQPFGERHKP